MLPIFFSLSNTMAGPQSHSNQQKKQLDSVTDYVQQLEVSKQVENELQGVRWSGEWVAGDQGIYSRD